MKNSIIETIDLTKVYKLKNNAEGFKALDNVNISINEREIFGLLGPNGAGKTTMISILTTLIQPTSGYATIDGFNIIKNPEKAKSRVALMLESDMLYFRITAYDNLKFFCKIYNVPNYREKITTMAKEFGIYSWLNQNVENFSSGMKMKLALCRTLLLDRKILFLDEPTLGLDVKTLNFVVNKIKEVNKTIFLTSHDMNVVEKLCSRIAFIDKGAIIRIGTKEYIQKLMQLENKIEIDIEKNKNLLKYELKELNYIDDVVDTKKGLIIILNNRLNYKDLLLILSKYPILKVKEHDYSIEELFLKII